MNTLIAFILLILLTYPSSPVFFLVFGIYNAELYILFSMILLFLVLLKKPRLTTGDVIYKKIFISYVLVYVTSFIFSRNITAIRDFLTISLVLFIIIGLPKDVFINILRKYILLNSVFLFASIVTTVIFYFIGFDEWEVSNLSMVSENNPAFTRSEWGDFHYFMPLYLTLITVSDSLTEIAFGITFERMPLLYDEPTSLWVATLGFFFYALGDYKMPFRSFVLPVLLISLLLSFSVYGILVLISMILYYLGMKIDWFRKNTRYLLLGLVLGIVFVYFNSYILDEFLTVIGGNKYQQYLYFSDEIDLKAAFSPFGLDVGEDTKHRSYGVLGVFVRYGVLGMIFYVYVWYLILMRTFKIYRNVPFASKSTIYFSMAVLSSLLLYLKNPQMNLLLPILFLAALEVLNSTYNSFSYRKVQIADKL